MRQLEELEDQDFLNLISDNEEENDESNSNNEDGFIWNRKRSFREQLKDLEGNGIHC